MFYLDEEYINNFDISPALVTRVLAEDCNKLLRLVPCGTPNLADYNAIFHANTDWHLVVQGLGQKLSDSKRRAAKMSFTHTLSLRDLARIWLEQEGKCYLTGCVMTITRGSSWEKNPYGVSIDRINNDIGYTKENIRLLCHWANNAKSTYNDAMFKSFVQLAAKKVENA